MRKSQALPSGRKVLRSLQQQCPTKTVGMLLLLLLLLFSIIIIIIITSVYKLGQGHGVKRKEES